MAQGIEDAVEHPFFARAGEQALDGGGPVFQPGGLGPDLLGAAQPLAGAAAQDEMQLTAAWLMGRTCLRLEFQFPLPVITQRMRDKARRAAVRETEEAGLCGAGVVGRAGDVAQRLQKSMHARMRRAEVQLRLHQHSHEGKLAAGRLSCQQEQPCRLALVQHLGDERLAVRFKAVVQGQDGRFQGVAQWQASIPQPWQPPLRRVGRRDRSLREFDSLRELFREQVERGAVMRCQHLPERVACLVIVEPRAQVATAPPLRQWHRAPRSTGWEGVKNDHHVCQHPR